MTRFSTLAAAAACLVSAILGAPTAAAAQQAPGLYDEGTVRTLELTFKQANWQTQLAANYASKTYIRADLKVDGKVYKDVGVRYRGNSSYKAVNSIKKPFKIAMNEFVAGQDLMGYSTINLNNGFRDPTFVREVLSFWIFRQYLPAPKCNWVKLVINSTSYGVYINPQQINSDLLEEWFRSSDGNRYRAERGVGGTSSSPALTWLGNVASNYKKGYELKTENAKNAWVDIMQLCNVLNNSGAAQLPSQLPKVLDVDESLRYLAANNLLPAVDSYIGNTAHNYYIYFDTYHGRAVLLPWDLNASFGGNAWLSVTQKQKLSPFYFMNASRPLLNNTLTNGKDNNEWRARYMAHIRTMLDRSYDWKILGPKVTQYQKLIAAEVQKDTLKLYSNQLFTDNVTKDVLIRVRFSNQWIPGLKPMVDNRRAHLQGLSEIKAPPPAISDLQHSPTAPTPNDLVWVTARVAAVPVSKVKLYHRLRGAYAEAQMFDDGQHKDGKAKDGVYGASIPKQPFGARVEYYVAARAQTQSGGALAFLPETAGHQPRRYRVLGKFNPTGPARINELLAENETGDRDAAGDRDDWVELHNIGQTTYDLSGHYLTDDLERPKRWQFPANTTIAPGGYLRIWTDGEPNEGKLHTNFKLEKNGEDLALFDVDARQNRLLDAVIFAQQKADRSFGRLPDGSGSFYYLWTPSGNGPATGTGTGRTLRFDTRLTGAPSGLDLKSQTAPRGGFGFTMNLEGGAPGPVVLGLSGAVQPLNMGPVGTLLLRTNSLAVLFLSLDARGKARLTATMPSSLVGVTLYAQALQKDLSNALAIRVSN